MRFLLSAAFLSFANFALGTAPLTDETTKSGPKSTNDLSMEVMALQSLHHFQFKPEQMQSLRKLARQTAMDAGARPAVKASEEFRRTLSSLRHALAEASNADHILALQQKMEKLRNDEKIELDDGVEITEAAAKHAPELMKTLSARQVAGYIALYGDEFPDPLELLLDALSRVRGFKDQEWKQIRQDISEDVANLVAGLDAEKASKIGDDVVQLLIKARGLKDDEFKKERPELEKAARQIVGNAPALDIIRNVVERSLAELLSNPWLVSAIDARLKK